MKKIKILISTYTEEIQMSDFCSLYFDTAAEALSFLHLFYESLSSERAMVIKLGDEYPLIYQTTDGFPFEEVEIELKDISQLPEIKTLDFTEPVKSYRIKPLSNILDDFINGNLNEDEINEIITRFDDIKKEYKRK